MESKTSSMQYTFLGVRGSTPASGCQFNKYGGHTSCSLVHFPGKDKILVDTGTGIIKWGEKLMREQKNRPLRLHVLYTHFHLDHLQGLLFFAPLYSPTTSITFYSVLDPKSLEKCLGELMGQNFFPVRFSDTPSKKIFRKVPSGLFRIGGIRISHHPLIHPQGALAYKFSANRKSVVLATDTEHPEEGLDEALAAFATGSDYLIYDSMFTPAEYRAGKKGWGHSTWEEGQKVAGRARIKNLFLSHFNPSHSDATVDRFLSLARKTFKKTFAAREGQTLNL